VFYLTKIIYFYLSPPCPPLRPKSAYSLRSTANISKSDVIENSFNKLNNKIKVSKPNELQIIPINLDHLAQSARVLYPKCVYSLWHNYAI
jgi:hypothetical protein